MTIEEVLAEVDEIKPNTYDDNIKLAWLSEIEGRIFNDIVLTHERQPVLDEEGNELELSTEFVPFKDIDFSKELIAPYPYTNLYRHYLFAMIDYSNGETESYTNSMTMFNAAYLDFAKWYNRTRLPVYRPLKLF